MLQQLVDAAHSYAGEVADKLEKLDSLAMLEREVDELERQNSFLSTFRDKFMLSEDQIKTL